MSTFCVEQFLCNFHFLYFNFTSYFSSFYLKDLMLLSIINPCFHILTNMHRHTHLQHTCFWEGISINLHISTKKSKLLRQVLFDEKKNYIFEKGNRIFSFFILIFASPPVFLSVCFCPDKKKYMNFFISMYSHIRYTAALLLADFLTFKIFFPHSFHDTMMLLIRLLMMLYIKVKTLPLKIIASLLRWGFLIKW